MIISIVKELRRVTLRSVHSHPPSALKKKKPRQNIFGQEYRFSLNCQFISYLLAVNHNETVVLVIE